MFKNILSQFGVDPKEKGYILGKITSTKPTGELQIETISGLQLTIKDKDLTYKVGQQIIFGTIKGDINNVFIIKKTDNMYPIAINLVIENDEG